MNCFHISFSSTYGWIDNWCFHYGICRIVIDTMFLHEILHVCIVKFLSSVSLQIFRTSFIISNYFCDHCIYIISALSLERYGPCILVQHIDNGENAMVTFVESRVRTHLDQIRLPQVIVSPNYDASSWKISPCRSVQFIHQPMLLGTFFSDIMICDIVLFIYSYHLLNLLKLIYHNLQVILERCNLCFDFILSIF